MVIAPIVNDGRINRSKTTLNKIVAATISLLRKNNNGQIPTAQEIAVKSGVGIRTVFRHIDDMEGLIEEVNRRYLHDLESYIAKNNPKNIPMIKETESNFNVMTEALKSLGKLLSINSKSINNPCYILLLIY